MRTEPKPYALDAGEGTAHWFFGSLVTVKAASEETDGRYALTEFVNPPAFASPLHVHHDEHEAFYVLEGRAEVHCGDESFNVGPGSFVMLPKGIPHWHQVGAEMPLRSLVLTTGQFELYVAACGEPARTPQLPPPGPPTWTGFQLLANASVSRPSGRLPRRRCRSGTRPALSAAQAPAAGCRLSMADFA